jgi:hypothetical protein
MKRTKNQTPGQEKTSAIKTILNLQAFVPETENDPIVSIDDIALYVLDLLIEDFAPQDTLEELWMSDIAKITANIQKFRAIEQSITLNQMLNKIHNRHDEREFLQKNSFSVKVFAERLSMNKPHWKHGTDGPALRIAANLSEGDIRQLAAINDLIIKLQRERDRIFAQFGRKRRPLIEVAVKKVEETGIPPQLSD